MISIRCSSLPLVAKCAQAIWPGTERPGNQQAREGTAVHDLMSELISPTEGGFKTVEDVCRGTSLDPEKVGMLYGQTRNCWNQIAHWFPEPRQSEQYLEGRWADLELTGHFDVLAFDAEGTIARILDFKTGWIDADCTEQMKGYGWLVCQHNPLVEKVWACVLRPRFKEVEILEWTREELDTWIKDLAKHLWKKDYAPSPETCRYCPRLTCALPCEHGVQAMQATAALIAQADEDDYEATIGNPVRAVQLARIIKKKCEEVEDWARAAVEASGGRLTSEADGVDLVLTAQDRETVSFGQAEPILRNLLGVDLPAVVQVGKSKLESAIRAKAGKGKGAGLVREVFEQLDAVGAIEVTTQYKMELKRTPKLLGAV